MPMIITILTAALALLEKLGPLLGSSALSRAIALIAEAVPFVIKEAKDLAPLVLNVIGVLKQNEQVSTAQLQELQKYENQLDANLEDALQRAEAEDAAYEGRGAPEPPPAATGVVSSAELGGGSLSSPNAEPELHETAPGENDPAGDQEEPPPGPAA